MKSRVVIVFICFLFLWGLLITKAIYVQVIPNKRLTQLKEKSFNRIVRLKSRRGDIFDRNHRELAISMPSYSLYADPSVVENHRKVAKRLGRYFRKSSSRYSKKLENKSRRFVWLERRLKKSQRDQIHLWKIRGLAFIEEPTRVYPKDQLFSHVLGFVGSEEQGLEGLELIYDDILKGTNRQLKFHRDARGRPLLANGQIFLDHPNGSHLYLTVDSGLQFKLETELQRVVNEFSAQRALGIILDAETSAILAMANWPTFDANNPLGPPNEVRRNKVVTDAFEPGSTLKTFTIAGAISQGQVQPNTKIDCEKGELHIGRHRIREASSQHKYGFLTVSEILSQSSNVGSAKVAFRLGDKGLRKVLKDFGFGEKTGIDLPGESKGILHKTPWRAHLLSNISFGHGITATALQIATAYGAIANGGLLKKPYIVQSIESESGVRKDFGPQVIRRVLDPHVASTMKLMLAGVTLPKGTGFRSRVHGFPVAGKTGTAQKVRVGGRGYIPGEYISSFVGFLPVHQPKYVIYIAVDSPKKQYYGSLVAAPVFSRVASYAVRKGGLAPVLLRQDDIIHKSLGDRKQGEFQHKALAGLRLQSLKEGRVPFLLGLPLREVYRQIADTDIELKVKGSGVVVRVAPEPSQKLPKNKKISVWLKPLK